MLLGCFFFSSSTRRFTLLPSDVSSAIIALGETSLQVITLSWEVNRGFHLKARLNKCGVQADRRTRWSLWKLISKGVPQVTQKVPDSLSVHTMEVIITPSCTEIVFSIPSVSHARSLYRPSSCPGPACVKTYTERTILKSRCLCFPVSAPFSDHTCCLPDMSQEERRKEECADRTTNKCFNRTSRKLLHGQISRVSPLNSLKRS